MNAQCAFECPDFFRMGDWYYLVLFFVCGPLSDDVPEEQKSVWTVADAGKIDTFDTRAFLCGKRREVMAFTDTFTAGIRQEKSSEHKF